MILSRLSDTGSALAQRFTRQIEQPFAFEDRSVPLGASIGVAVFPADGAELDSLLEHADQAVYRTRRARRAPVAASS